MCGFLLRIIINSLVLFLVMMKLPGIFVDTLGSTLLGATIVGVANAAIRPIISLVFAEINSLKLGGLTFLTNVFMPVMVIKTIPGFQISGNLASMAAILLMTTCSYALSKFIQDR